jgi:3-oxoacyl-[acyl-carrier protein] reductase
MELGLDGKIALVTGASSGIGAACALCFAQEGADVVITWHGNEAGAASTAQAIRALGRRAWLLRMDMSDTSSVDAALAQAGGETAGLDCLVLNAGRNVVTPLGEITPEEWG